MSKNYYCSGFDVENAFKGEFEKNLKNDLQKTIRIVYIPGGVQKENIEKTFNIYVPAFIKHFKRINIEIENINILTPNTTTEEARNWIENSDMVFLMGGNPFVQKQLLESKGLTKLLKNYDGVVLGISAGAMNMSKYIIITPCSEEYPKFQIEDGLNLSNISVYPHINFSGNNVPENIDSDKENISMKDLMKVSEEYGEFYCLQDYFDGKKHM